MIEDSELLRRYASERSESAFSEVVRRHIGLVYSVALRQVSGDRQLAEDVAQRVFADLARKAGRVATCATLGGWLYRSAHFAASDAVRAERRRRAREEEIRVMQEITSDSGCDPDWDRLRPLLDQAMGDLSEGDRDAVVLRFYEGRAFADVGRRLRLTEDAARMRVDRALDKLGRMLAKKGYSSTSAVLAVALANQTAVAVPSGLAASIVGSTIASTGSAATAAAPLFQIMTTTKILVAVAVVEVVAIGLLHTRQSALYEAQAVLEAVDRRHEVSRRNLAELERRSTRAREQQTELRLALEKRSVAARAVSPPPIASKPAPSAQGPSVPTSDKSPINWKLSANPEVRQALSDWIKGSSRMMLASFYRARGFSVERMDAFEDLLVQGDINMDAAWLTLRPESVSLQQVIQKIREFLGEADYDAYRTYQKTSFVRRVTDGLAGNLYDTATPLTTFQAEQLTKVLMDSVPQTQRNGVPFPSMITWPAALERAQAVLSPAQLATFRKQAEILSGEPGLWGGINPMNPGFFGNSANPPSSVFAASAPRK